MPDGHTYHFNIRCPPPALRDKNVDEDDESPLEQGKRTPISAKSLSGLVKSKGAKARPKAV